MKAKKFYDRGWQQFEYDLILAQWVEHALPRARSTIASPQFAQWFRYQNTWFAGVNALDNDPHGAVASPGNEPENGSGPLRGVAIDFLSDKLGFKNTVWDKGQLSVCYPGYPKPSSKETLEAHNYRVRRGAAHVDGFIPEGPHRRRHLREYHAFILGIPMVEFSADASPFIIWEGSHKIIQQAIMERLGDLPSEQWADEDVTETYQQARREVFQCCPRVELYAQPGEAFIAHRLSVHGMGPWGDDAEATEDGRMICYFRPEMNGPTYWLNQM